MTQASVYAGHMPPPQPYYGQQYAPPHVQPISIQHVQMPPASGVGENALRQRQAHPIVLACNAAVVFIIPWGFLFGLSAGSADYGWCWFLIAAGLVTITEVIAVNNVEKHNPSVASGIALGLSIPVNVAIFAFALAIETDFKAKCSQPVQQLTERSFPVAFPYDCDNEVDLPTLPPIYLHTPQSASICRPTKAGLSLTLLAWLSARLWALWRI